MAGRRLGELTAAFGLLTRFPVPSGPIAAVAPAAAVWAYPIVGLGVGAVAAAVLRVAAALGLPPLAGASLALAAMALATGGLHEDGFADTVDALSGGRTAARRLMILRDSRVGAHGALALALLVLLRGAALAAIPALSATPLGGVVAAAVLGRAAMLPVLLVAAPARPDGLGAALGIATARRGAAGITLGIMLGFALAPPVVVVAGLVAGGGAGAWAARRRFGGFTGDVLGFAAVTGETAALLALVAHR